MIKPPEQTLARDVKGLVLQIGFTSRRKSNGYEIIPSIAQFEPVSLRQGEATQIMTKLKQNKTVESLSGGEEIRVKYVIHETWGARVELWHEDNETITQIKSR